MLHGSFERGVKKIKIKIKICERNNPADTKVREAGRGGKWCSQHQHRSSPAACGEDNDEACCCPAAPGGHHITAGGHVLKEAAGTVACAGPMLERFVPDTQT